MNNNRVDKKAILVSSSEIESIEVDNIEELEVLNLYQGNLTNSGKGGCWK